jgi:hypothetical protein
MANSLIQIFPDNLELFSNDTTMPKNHPQRLCNKFDRSDLNNGNRYFELTTMNGHKYSKMQNSK